MRLIGRPDHSFVSVAAAVGIFWLLMLSGCATLSPSAPSDAERCVRLQDVIAQADTRFDKFKTTPTINPFSGGTRWETKPVFPDSQCDVVEWGGGRINYICTWRAGGESEARETYQENANSIGSCLGNSWQRVETHGRTGLATSFAKAGTATRVVMRYSKPRAGYRSTWETSLTIGDEVTPDAR